MKIGIIIGVANYDGSVLSNLPGCERDVRLIKAILSAQDDFVEILEISTDTRSANVKQQLIEFITKHKTNEISELVFYYTGHGAFINGEYYYLLSDYQSTRLRQTSLENSELDNLIRSLSPSLTTKLIDACQSGVPYIKDQGEIQTYLKGTQAQFKTCYFMFSSHTDEASYQDNMLSGFTRSLGELVSSRTGVVRHKDLIDYVSDSFAQNSTQTPFFVIQADFTDLFCKVDTTLQKRIADLLVTAKVSTWQTTNRAGEVTGSALKKLVVNDALYYCTEEEARQSLTRLQNVAQGYTHPAEAAELFDISLLTLTDYSMVPNMIQLGKWFEENKHPFFAETIKEPYKTKKLRSWTTLAKLSTVLTVGGGLTDSDYEEVVEYRINSVRPTTEMPYASLMFKATSRFPNIDSTSCFFVPFVSRTHMIIFVGVAAYNVRGWGEESLSQDVNWRSYQERMKDQEALKKTVNIALDNFWESILTPLKKKFGLLVDETQQPAIAQAGEQSVDSEAIETTPKKS